MDDFEILGKTVGSVGFPIFCCVWLATIGKRSIEALIKSNDNLATEIKKFAEAAGRHSPVLERIESKVDHLAANFAHHAELFIEFKSKTEGRNRND